LIGGLSLVVSVGLLTWWAIGSHDSGTDHLLGPFDVPTWVATATVATGWGLLGLAAIAQTVPALRRGPRLARLTVVLLAVDAAFAAAALRVLTIGVDGANIGGGLLLLAGPALFITPLVFGVLVEVRRRGLSTAYTVGVVIVGTLTVVALQSLLWL
jgi:hypothetical protein